MVSVKLSNSCSTCLKSCLSKSLISSSLTIHEVTGFLTSYFFSITYLDVSISCSSSLLASTRLPTLGLSYYFFLMSSLISMRASSLSSSSSSTLVIYSTWIRKEFTCGFAYYFLVYFLPCLRFLSFILVLVWSEGV